MPETMSPKVVGWAEEELAVMLADGVLDHAGTATWDGWRDGPVHRPDRNGMVDLPGPVADLFRRALRRVLARLEARLASAEAAGAADEAADEANDIRRLRTLLG